MLELRSPLLYTAMLENGVRVPRDPATGMHPEVRGLFPTGEGAGYAGGIVSAALDGERMADAAADYVEHATMR